MDDDGHPLSVSSTGAPEQNVILWMDHRAEPETESINATRHPVLQFTGGKLSIEMQLPKLKWIQNVSLHFIYHTNMTCY